MDILIITAWYLTRRRIGSTTGGRQTTKHNDGRYPGAQKNVQPEDAKSIWIEDGSFLRLKQLTLSYSFDKLSVLKNPRIFVTGTNLLTFTKYTGYDPEVSSYAQSLLQQGIDYGAYPAQRSYTLGFSFNF